MTPHEKALEAAIGVALESWNYPTERDGFEAACKTYLTTILDSPEMVEKVVVAMYGYYSPRAEIISRAKAVIKAIKEAAGL